MATTEQDQLSHKQQEQQRVHAESIWNIIANKRPSTPHLVLIPLGATLLLLAGLTLAASVVGLMIAGPLLLLFSPIIVPAVVTIVLAVLGILTSGAFGVTGLASVLWLANYLRAVRPWQQAAEYLGRRTDELGLKIKHKAHEDERAQKVDASL